MYWNKLNEEAGLSILEDYEKVDTSSLRNRRQFK